MAAALVVLVSVGVAGLFVYAWSGVQAGIAERHTAALDAVFEDLDRELAERVAREQARSFLEYRFLYVPLDNANPAIVRSPLSRTPEDPAIRGYFSLDPDDVFRTPSTPRGNEVEYVNRNGWIPGSPNEDLERLVRALPAAAGPGSTEVVPTRALRDPTTANPAVQVINTKQYNFGTFENEANRFEPGPDAQTDVTVQVRPFVGFRRGSDLVVLREVLAQGKVYRQGFVLDLVRLGDDVSAKVLVGRHPEVSLSWTGERPAGRWVREHAFAAPLQDLHVSAGISEVPALVAGSRSGVLALGAAVLAAVLGGSLLLARGVWVELAFAERRSNFVSAVTHELKTPLTTLRMYAEMLRDGMVPEERRAEYLTTLVTESDRLGRLVGNVLTLSQLEQGTSTTTVVVGEAAEVLRAALELVRPHAARAGMALEVDTEPGLPPVRLDRDALIQVVVNLADNAVKFAPAGQTLTFALRRCPSGVELTVRDRGPGVPPEQLGLVFEPFWRGERELVRRTRGTGIGLTLVRGLVRGMGGEVDARNATGGGFEVAVRLTSP